MGGASGGGRLRWEGQRASS